MRCGHPVTLPMLLSATPGHTPPPPPGPEFNPAPNWRFPRWIHGKQRSIRPETTRRVWTAPTLGESLTRKTATIRGSHSPEERPPPGGVTHQENSHHQGESLTRRTATIRGSWGSVFSSILILMQTSSFCCDVWDVSVDCVIG